MKRTILLVLLPVLILAAAYTQRPLTWVAIGDSITYLNDHTDETGDRVTKGYLTRVTEKLPNIHYINQGHNGWTAGKIARDINKLGIPVADVYSVLLGTNDWWQGVHIGSFQDYRNNTGDSTVYVSFRIILDKVRSLNKDAAIILITPMQRGDFVYLMSMKNNAHGSYRDKDGQTLEDIANAIIDIGQQEHIKIIDLYHERRLSVSHAVHFKRLRDPKTGQPTDYHYPEYTGIPFNPATDEYPYPPDAINITYDGLHPSDKGNAIIAKKLVKVLKKL